MASNVTETGERSIDPSPSVLIDDRGDFVRLFLDRPPLNIIDVETSLLLAEAIRRVVDRPELKALVLTGSGGRAFSAGVEISDHSPERAREMLESFHSVIIELDRIGAVTIAAVKGVALGGGCELAGFCDLVVAEETSRFGLPEIKLGCFPPVAAITFPHIIGPKRTAELIFSGEPITGKRAHEIGLVSRLAKPGSLEEELEIYLGPILDKSPAVLGITREAIRRSPRGRDLADALHHAEDLYLNRLLNTHDAQEGLSAFLEKRPPRWEGR